MHINYHVVGGFFDEFCKEFCKLKFSALYQMRKDRKKKSMVNTLGRCFWSQGNCDLISASNLGFLFDVTNSILDAIKILIVCLQNNNSVTSFSSLVHKCYKINLKIKEDEAFTNPWDFATRNCKDIYQSQLVCGKVQIAGWNQRFQKEKIWIARWNGKQW